VAPVIPAVDQIEVNPYLTQDELRSFCAEHQIAVEAWSPLGRGAVLGSPGPAAGVTRSRPPGGV
jgi:2,5-diketo-D-gluconate reductase A